MTKFVEFVAHKNRHEFHENSPVVARASRPWEAGLEFSLHVAQARGRLKPELQTGRPRRNEAFARRDVAWPGPRVDPPVPTGGTPVPRGLASSCLSGCFTRPLYVVLGRYDRRALPPDFAPVSTSVRD